jgi:preprotein translocase subunit SecE
MLGVRVPPGLPFYFLLKLIKVIVLMDKVKLIIAKLKQFLKEAQFELKKVTWPTPKQALASTSVVIIVVIIISAFLGIVDFGLTKIIRFVLG